MLTARYSPSASRPLSAAGSRTAQARHQPRAERARAPDDVLPQAALRLVDAERHRVVQGRAEQAAVDARLVEAVPELVQPAVERDREVLLVVLGGEPDVVGRDRGGERVHGRVEAHRIRVEADALEDIEHRDPLRVGPEPAEEGAAVADHLLGGAGGGDDGHEGIAQLGEERAELGGREAGLEVVEQRVVRMLVALEAGDVAVPQLDLAGEGVAEPPEVVRGARLLPCLLAERVGLRDLRGQLGGDADRFLEVAPRPVDEPDVVGVRVLAGRPRLERVEQRAELRVALAGVDGEGDRRRPLGPRRGAGRGHHRLLVPEQQHPDPVQVAELRHPRPQRGDLGRHRAARSYTSSSSAPASASSKCSER